VSLQPDGIHAITMFVADKSRAKQFYEEIFGLTVVFEDAHSVVFRIGETLINLLVDTEADELIAPAVVAARASGARFVFTVTVPDVDHVCAELARRGVDLLNGPMDRPWGPRTASFMDPDGHIWEIAS
jgi:catechol 2,3-dioxygenase-like lactoylglutathione lyase family enzyme